MKIQEVLKKLHYQGDLKGSVLNAPAPIEKEFRELGFPTTLKEGSQFTILFTKDKNDLETNIRTTLDYIEYYTILGIAYPKGSASMKTDINRDKLWGLLKPYGYRPVSQIAITTIGLRCGLRPMEKVRSRK